MWDNVKYLVYAFLGATPVLALLLARLMRRPSPWTRWLGAVLLCLLVIAGLLDVVRVSRGLMKQRIFTAEDVACAALVRQHTPPQARVLHAPTYNSPVYLTGRRSLLGYPGHIFSHGLDAGSREEAISGIYRGDPEAQELVAKHRIDYILLGRQERQTLGAGAAAFSHCRLVAQAPGCLLFDARCR
jgi:hypothetical protein